MEYKAEQQQTYVGRSPRGGRGLKFDFDRGILPDRGRVALLAEGVD